MKIFFVRITKQGPRLTAPKLVLKVDGVCTSQRIANALFIRIILNVGKAYYQMKFKNIKPLYSRKETHILTDESGMRRGAVEMGSKCRRGGQRKLNFSKYRSQMIPKLCFIKKVSISSCLQSLGHLAEILRTPQYVEIVFPPQSVYCVNDSLFLTYLSLVQFRLSASDWFSSCFHALLLITGVPSMVLGSEL